VPVPCTEVAAELGRPMVKNVVAMGALQEATRLFPDETYLTAIRQALADKRALVEVNEKAFQRGMAQARSNQEVPCES